MKAPKHLISLDTGVPCGFARWVDGELVHHQVIHPLATITVWEDRLNYVLDQIETEVPESAFGSKDKIIAAEFPHFREDATGLAAAGAGSLVKLSAAYGAIIRLAHDLDWTFLAVRPIDWLGQLRPVIVKKRIERILGPMPDLKSHAVDAVGIGLFVMGKF